MAFKNIDIQNCELEMFSQHSNHYYLKIALPCYFYIRALSTRKMPPMCVSSILQTSNPNSDSIELCTSFRKQKRNKKESTISCIQSSPTIIVVVIVVAAAAAVAVVNVNVVVFKKLCYFIY